MSIKHKLLTILMGLCAAVPAATADSMDAEGYPLLYILGESNTWTSNDKYLMSRTGSEYSITLSSLDGPFKIGSDEWSYNLGGNATITEPVNLTLRHDGANLRADNLKNVTIKFNLTQKDAPMPDTYVQFGIDGKFAEIDPQPPVDDPKGQLDSEGYPIVYLRGQMSEWACDPQYRFTRYGQTYTLSVSYLDGQFKIADNQWGADLGVETAGTTIVAPITLSTLPAGSNFNASNLSNVKITFTVPAKEYPWENVTVAFSVNGVEPDPDPKPTIPGLSGTLPVLYVNAYKVDSEGNFILDNAGNKILENELIDANLSHKNYFTGEYWLDMNNCQWLIDLGGESIGSKEEPLPLEIKARGNYTRKAFAKKPFKLKLGKKQNLLGLTPKKSKHYAILAHADDTYGYLRNFTGFNLGKRIGLPWTPGMQPIEVVINGDYRGLYFLTESIRIGDGRINITELDDNVTDSRLISGGYLVELDNYDEDNQTRMEEKTCTPWQYCDVLRVTWDTPEVYSELQQRFITDQFMAMNDAVGACSNDLWSYMDLDDAVRYYIVREIISDVESYHGSTYMFRDYGDNQKWHFSPLWDHGNAFNGSTTEFFYDNDPYGNTWIPSMRENEMFNDKVKETWKWFMGNYYDGLYDDMTAYIDHITAATQADYNRWANASVPDNGQRNADNRDLRSKLNSAVNHLNDKTNWLRSQWGEYQAGAPEPARDTTPAAKLPDYAATGVETVAVDNTVDTTARYIDIYGRTVSHPAKGQLLIKLQSKTATKIIY